MEYKEVQTRKGETIVFCNFEELLLESFGVKTKDELPPPNSNGEYICHCPFCREQGHTKHKLYLKSDMTVGHCFVCCRAFVNVTDEVIVDYAVPDFMSMMCGWQGFNVVPLTDPTWSLDKYNYDFDDYSEEGIKYLLGRHKYMEELWKILDFKFWEGNIVMPFKYHGEIFYYQIRFIEGSRIRYFFPPISKKPPYIIEHGDNKQFIICEGVYDAIALLLMAPGYTPMAVLGSSISDYQMEFLREYLPTKIIVYMDDTEKSTGIMRRLKTTLDYCPIYIIKSDGQDPEENMKERIKRGKKLSWIC